MHPPEIWTTTDANLRSQFKPDDNSGSLAKTWSARDNIFRREIKIARGEPASYFSPHVVIATLT
jgi:hypothetical protein